MSADKDSAKPSGITVSGQEIHAMLKELKPLLWVVLVVLSLLATHISGG